MEKAIYLNGEPQNLPAASLDAMEWLKAIKHIFAKRMTCEANDRLDRATEALQRFLDPHLPQVESFSDIAHQPN